MRCKSGVEREVIRWIIAIIVIAFAIIAITLMQKQIIGLIEKLKNFLMFGR